MTSVGPREAPIDFAGNKVSCIRGLLRGIETGADILVVLALMGQLTIVLATIVARSVSSYSLVWGDEVSQITLTVVTFVGGAVGYRRGMQIHVRALTDRLLPGVREVLAAFTDWLVAGIALSIAITSSLLIMRDWTDHTPVLQIPSSAAIVPLTVGMLLFALEAGRSLSARSPKHRWIAAGPFCLILALASITTVASPGRLAGGELVIAIVSCFLALLVLGVPIAFALLASVSFFLLISNSASLVVLPQQMNDAIGNFILLAIPFFILAGLIMAYGGLGRRISDFVGSLIGHLRSGPLQVIIVSMYIFSGLSGSKSADMAAVGSTMKDLAQARGYARGEVAAVLAASAVMGETIPPSIAMLVLGSVTTLSIAALFMSGLLPAAVLAVAIMLHAYLRSRRSGPSPTPRASPEQIRRAVVTALLPMLLPIILIGGVLTGIATPTEISSVAVIYGLLLAIGLYRELTPMGLWRAASETAAMSGMILFIISAAAPFSWTMAMAQVPDQIAKLIALAGNRQWLFMLGSILALIISGALLESVPALIIFAPLLLPIATDIRIDPMQFGIVLILSMGWGTYIPPIGVGSYVACIITGATFEETARPLLGYMAILLIAIVLVALAPSLTLFVPDLMGLSH